MHFRLAFPAAEPRFSLLLLFARAPVPVFSQSPGDLLNMADTLASTVASLNTATERQLDPDNPLAAVLKILNVHHNSLSWIDDTASQLQHALTAVQRNVSQMQVQDQTQMRGTRQNAYGDGQWQRY